MDEQKRIDDPAIGSPIPEIEEALDKFEKARQDKVKVERKRVAAYDKLKELMTEHELDSYESFHMPKIVRLKHRDDEIRVDERKAGKAKES